MKVYSPASRPRVVVAGSGFGRTYLRALARPGSEFELVGLVGRGSKRSHVCAEAYGVPLLPSVADIPENVSIAGVAVGSALTGGAGTQMAIELMERGMHVVLEHPLHPDELAEVLRVSRRTGTVVRVSTVHVGTPVIRTFLEAAAALARRRPLLFLEVVTGQQMTYACLDVLARLLGGLRPWDLALLPRRGAQVTPPFGTLEGTVARTPLSLRIQDTMDPRQPDNHLHTLLRVVVTTDAGQLTLVDHAGPVVWTPRSHLPADVAVTPTLGEAGGSGRQTSTLLTSASAPTFRRLVDEGWPDAVHRSFTAVRDATGQGPAGSAREDQLALAVAELALEVTRLHPPRLIDLLPPQLLSAGELFGPIAGVSEDAP